MTNPNYVLEFEKPLRELSRQLDELRQQSIEKNIDLGEEIRSIEAKIEATRRDIYTHLTAWQRVLIARHPQRPHALYFVGAIFEGFQEFHGDRRFRDDRALVGGPAFFGGEAVMIVAQEKGRETKDKIERNFGHAHPEGYRKALRLMEMAEKFRLPVISFIDTPGAFPGVGSEERHVSEAIAVNLREMSQLTVPTLSVVVGEGGSGGALGIGVTDRVIVFENSYYSVITPEGCAAILWKDNAASPRAAEALKLSASHLEKLGVVDEVVPEPLGGAHNDPEEAARNLKQALARHFQQIRQTPPEQLLERRYGRYRHLGVFEEAGVAKS